MISFTDLNFRMACKHTIDMIAAVDSEGGIGQYKNSMYPYTYS